MGRHKTRGEAKVAVDVDRSDAEIAARPDHTSRLCEEGARKPPAPPQSGLWVKIPPAPPRLSVPHPRFPPAPGASLVPDPCRARPPAPPPLFVSRRPAP